MQPESEPPEAAASPRVFQGNSISALGMLFSEKTESAEHAQSTHQTIKPHRRVSKAENRDEVTRFCKRKMFEVQTDHSVWTWRVGLLF